MIQHDIYVSDFPRTFEQFQQEIGASNWKQCARKVREDIKRNHFLRDYLEEIHLISLSLNKCSDLIDRYGAFPIESARISGLYQAMGFATQVLSLLNFASTPQRESLIGRVRGALRNAEEMRGLRLELSAATHFSKLNHKIFWLDEEKGGTFDFLIPTLGRDGLEVECKSQGPDKGRRISRQDVLEFHHFVNPELISASKKLTSGLAVVLTVPNHLPQNHRDRKSLAEKVKRQILVGASTNLDDGTLIQILDFEIDRSNHINHSSDKHGLRVFVDDVTHTSNREFVFIKSDAGGSLVLVIQSIKNDTFLENLNDTLSLAAKKQFSKKRPALFFVELNGIDSESLIDIGEQDSDPSMTPTGLRIATSNFLDSKNRDHVIGVNYVGRTTLQRDFNGVMNSSGSAYYFKKKESRFWHDSFDELFRLT